MESVYVVSRSEYREDGTDKSIVAIHKTFEGAKERFQRSVAKERADYMYEQTGSTSATEEDLELAGVTEEYQKDINGEILDWHIWQPDGWNEVFVHIYRHALCE